MKAQEILDQVGIGGPATNLVGIAHYHSIDVIIATSADWDGALDLNEKPTIYVNGGNEVTRQRFTIAHELGHYFLHKHEQKAFRDKFETQKFNINEFEANKFALELLLPSHWVRAYSRYLNDDIEMGKLFGVSPMLIDLRLRSLNLRS